MRGWRVRFILLPKVTTKNHFFYYFEDKQGRLNPHTLKIRTEYDGTDPKREIAQAMEAAKDHLNMIGYPDTPVYYLTTVEPPAIRVIVHKGIIISAFSKQGDETPDLGIYDVDSWMYEPGRDVAHAEEWIKERMQRDGFIEMNLSHTQIEAGH